MWAKILIFRPGVPVYPLIRRRGKRGLDIMYIIWKEILYRAALVRTIFLQKFISRRFTSEKSKISVEICNKRKFEIYVIFGVPLQTYYKGVARKTTFAWNIFPKFITLTGKSQQNEFWGHIHPPGENVQELLTCFPILNCNIGCYQQLSQVSDHHLRMQGWSRFRSRIAKLNLLRIH